MADKNKDAKTPSPKDASSKVSHDELRELDVLDSKVENVKGGAARRRKRTRI